MRKLLDKIVVIYLKLHHMVNHKWDNKNVIHFGFGLIAGILAAYLYISGYLITAFLVSVLFMIANYAFHHYFKSTPVTSIIVNYDDECDAEKLDEIMRESIKEAVNTNEKQKENFHNDNED